MDGSYIKIRNVTIGYSLSNKVLKKINISKLRFYISARNFLTVSKIKDFDPENNGSFETPLNKLVVAGINVDF
ncbi:MAG: hypothetical protein ORN85_01825 [Sediminibacterium sp.]|nr:hypothetical protein [Sediminibacterium sp.]